MSEQISADQWFEIGKKYLDMGWSIIPIGYDKKPLGSWMQYQSEWVKPDQLQKWCHNPAFAGLALVTGKLTNIFVLDVDLGSTFDISSLPTTPCSKTGSGGKHFYFSFPENVMLRNSVKFQPHTDTRGDGGYAILPPSKHPSGQSYEWIIDPFTTPLATIPSTLLELLRKPINRKISSDGDINIFEGVQESSRNDSATRVIGKLLHQFKPDDWDKEVWPLVKAWNDKNNPPLDEQELLTTYNSIKRKAIEDEETDGQKATQGGQAGQIVNLVQQGKIEVFLNHLQEPYITTPNCSFIAEPIKSKKAEQLLCKLYWEKYRKPTSTKATADAINTLSGISRYDSSPVRKVNNRIAKHQGCVYYDIGDNEHVVHITTEGWTVESTSPVLFQRFSHQVPQVIPQSGGNLINLLKVVNITDPDSQLLFLTHLVTCFLPDIPRAAFALHGDPGSAKSTLLKLMRSLIDPSSTALITSAPNVNELIQVASHQYCVFLDNLSSLPTWISDIICRMVTGDAFSKREIYTVDDDVLYTFMRTVGICGVNLVATKPDLLSRCLIITLDLIDETRRKEEAVVIREFEEQKPYFMGAIFDCLSYCLRIAPTLVLPTLPRMADHFRYSSAAAIFLGHTADDMKRISLSNTLKQNEEAVEASSVAQVVIDFMSGRDEWTGTSTKLFGELKDVAEKLKVEKDFPKSASWLWKRINEVRSNLLANKIMAKRSRKGSANIIELTIVGSEAITKQQEIAFPDDTNGSMEAVEAEILPF